jgi:hypothetical protein
MVWKWFATSLFSAHLFRSLRVSIVWQSIAGFWVHERATIAGNCAEEQGEGTAQAQPVAAACRFRTRLHAKPLYHLRANAWLKVGVYFECPSYYRLRRATHNPKLAQHERDFRS